MWRFRWNPRESYGNDDEHAPTPNETSDPDADIFRLALDIAQVPAEQVVYIDDQPLFVQVAEGLGIHGIRHTNYQSTCETLASFGLQSDGGVIHGTR